MRSYWSYLTPFVDWAAERAQRGVTLVSTQTVKQFVEQRYRTGGKETYVRIYSQIVDFVNSYLETRIRRVSASGLKKRKIKLQFPAGSVEAVHRYLASQCSTLRDKALSRATRRKMAKCLGK